MEQFSDDDIRILFDQTLLSKLAHDMESRGAVSSDEYDVYIVHVAI